MLISIFCFGNPSRGDDAAGEHIYQWLSHIISSDSLTNKDVSIRLVVDYQLEPEHIFDLDGADLGIFIDCHLATKEAFLWQSVDVGQKLMITSHSVTAESLLFLYENTLNKPSPPSYLLGIAGSQFGLGDPISPTTKSNLDAAKEFLLEKLSSNHALKELVYDRLRVKRPASV